MLKIVAEGSDGKYTFTQLLEIMRVLRGPNGCPWDREQTHGSIRNDAIEEIYEVADAIDTQDDAALCEELGDVLLQVVFHAQIAKEEGSFTFDDIVDTIAKKLVLRHPHVFAENHVDSSSEVLDLWDSIKKEEKHQETFTDTLKSVPRAFPALMRAAKLQKRAIKAGFSLDGVSVEEKLRIFQNANSPEEKFAAYGELLFAVAGLQNVIKINAEEALNAASDRFIDDFEKDEKSGKYSH